MSVRMPLALLTGVVCFFDVALAGPPAPPPLPAPVMDAQSGCCPLLPVCCPPEPPRRGRAELDADYLLWWTKSSPLPVLAVTSSPADLGLLGAPSTTAVIGEQNADFNTRSGGRFAGRYLLDSGVGLGLGGFFLGTGTATQSAGALPVLAVPTVDPFADAVAAVRLASPGAATGSAAAYLSTQLWGLDASGLYRLGGSEYDPYQVDVLLGYRFLQFSESLAFRTTTTIAGPGLFAGQVAPPGSTYAGVDSFSTRNTFHGGQVGARGTFWAGRFCLQTNASVALGTIQQTLNVGGSTTLLPPGLPSETAPGNIYTQTSNIGRHTSDRFGVIPQAGLSVGYQVTAMARLMVGYDFLYVSSVLRPGDQIDPVVNPFLPPIQDDGSRLGPDRPAPRLNPTDFWAQGVTFSLQLSY